MDWQFLKLDTVEDYLQKETRVRIFSDAFLELGYLFCLNKFLISKKPKYIVMALLGMLFIFLQGFRTLIIIGVFVSFVMILRTYKVSARSIVISAFISLIVLTAVSQIPLLQEKIEEITNRDETQNFQNDDYIRWLDIYYTYNQFFVNPAEIVLGAGRTPFTNLNNTTQTTGYLSDYSKERTMLATDLHYYPVDLGFLGLSWETGIPFAVIAVLLFIYPWIIKVDRKYYYISCYGLYMILIGLTHPQGYYQSNLICLAVAYTILELAHREAEGFMHNKTIKKD